MRNLLPLQWLTSLLALSFLPAWADAPAAPADAIIGDWLVDSRDAIVHIDAAGGDDRHYDGHIVWLKDDHYHPADGPELDGKPVMDLNNPTPEKRNRPLLGLTLLWDLRFDGNLWAGGRVYNADNGHSYNCTVRLIDSAHLKLRGYIGVPLLGGSTVWTRVDGVPTPGSSGPSP
jgi:uncharacterized protein (DUF2147 family)